MWDSCQFKFLLHLAATVSASGNVALKSMMANSRHHNGQQHPPTGELNAVERRNLY